MRTFYFTLVCFASTVSSFAAEPKSPEVNRALREYREAKNKLSAQYHKAVDDLNMTYEKEMKTHHAKLIFELTTALNSAAQRVDLEEANAIKALIEQIKKTNLGPPSSDVVVSPNTNANPEFPKVVIPKEAVEFEGHHYYLVGDAERATWHVARERCQALGGHLVRIDSAAENQFVFPLATSGKDLGLVMIDGTDEVREGQWVYSDGMQMKYFNWGPRSPNNVDDLEHYAAMMSGPKATGTWDDKRGGFRHYYICEWDQ